MRICLINSFYYPDIIGGAELSILKLSEQLFIEGHEVHVICTGVKESIEKINGVVIHRIKINNLYSPIDIIKNSELNKAKRKIYTLLDNYNIFNYYIIENKLKEINPQIVHINNIYGISSIICKICKENNIATIQTLRDYSLLKDGKSFVEKIKNRINKNITKNISYVTAPSKYTLNKFINKNYFYNSQKKVIYNAIDFNKDKMEYILKEKKKRIFNNNLVKFVFLGRLERDKGIEILIEAFKAIEDENIQLFIAGKGEMEKYIRNACRSDLRIKYLGFINENDVNKLLEKSDILIIPSLWPEPFGRVIIEAYKYAMPVIGTNIGGIPEILNCKTGKLIKPNNVEELIESIQYFKKKENIIRYMDNCVKEVQKYDIKKHANEFIQVYKEAIKIGEKNV